MEANGNHTQNTENQNNRTVREIATHARRAVRRVGDGGVAAVTPPSMPHAAIAGDGLARADVLAMLQLLLRWRE